MRRRRRRPVHGLVGHAAGDGSVADDGDAVVAPLVRQVLPHAHPCPRQHTRAHTSSALLHAPTPCIPASQHTSRRVCWRDAKLFSGLREEGAGREGRRPRAALMEVEECPAPKQSNLHTQNTHRKRNTPTTRQDKTNTLSPCPHIPFPRLPARYRTVSTGVPRCIAGPRCLAHCSGRARPRPPSFPPSSAHHHTQHGAMPLHPSLARSFSPSCSLSRSCSISLALLLLLATRGGGARTRTLCVW